MSNDPFKGKTYSSGFVDLFNKTCAEALGWESHIVKASENWPKDVEWFIWPEELNRLKLSYNGLKAGSYSFKGKVSEMHFHDSRDWIWLLVDRCPRALLFEAIHEDIEGKGEYIPTPINVFTWLCTSSPIQLGQVCLAVIVASSIEKSGNEQV